MRGNLPPCWNIDRQYLKFNFQQNWHSVEEKWKMVEISRAVASNPFFFWSWKPPCGKMMRQTRIYLTVDYVLGTCKRRPAPKICSFWSIHQDRWRVSAKRSPSRWFLLSSIHSERTITSTSTASAKHLSPSYLVSETNSFRFEPNYCYCNRSWCCKDLDWIELRFGLINRLIWKTWGNWNWPWNKRQRLISPTSARLSQRHLKFSPMYVISFSDAYDLWSNPIDLQL